MNTILLAAIDLTTILPFALFGAVALGMWVVADTFMGGRSKTESRVQIQLEHKLIFDFAH